MGQIIDHVPQDITPPCHMLTVNGECPGAVDMARELATNMRSAVSEMREAKEV